jgi:hypothetical protein
MALAPEQREVVAGKHAGAQMVSNMKLPSKLALHAAPAMPPVGPSSAPADRGRS